MAEADRTRGRQRGCCTLCTLCARIIIVQMILRRMLWSTLYSNKWNYRIIIPGLISKKQLVIAYCVTIIEKSQRIRAMKCRLYGGLFGHEAYDLGIWLSESEMWHISNMTIFCNIIIAAQCQCIKYNLRSPSARYHLKAPCFNAESVSEHCGSKSANMI